MLNGCLDVILDTCRGNGSFSVITVTGAALTVLFERILNRDLSVHEELTVHVLDRFICCFKRCE